MCGHVSSYEVNVVVCEGSSCEDLSCSIRWPHSQAIADMSKQRGNKYHVSTWSPEGKMAEISLTGRTAGGSGTSLHNLGQVLPETFAWCFLWLRHVRVTFISHLCQLTACSVLQYIGFLGKNSCRCR